ncbi:MAG: hypothetical protein IPL74_14530 [Bacteroidetes bacterium]|nr:hypothetical protein [Bacteroidota bacterium]
MLFLLCRLLPLKWDAVVKNPKSADVLYVFTFSVFVLIGLTTPSMGAIIAL